MLKSRRVRLIIGVLVAALFLSALVFAISNWKKDSTDPATVTPTSAEGWKEYKTSEAKTDEDKANASQQEGNYLASSGKAAEALASYEEAVATKPNPTHVDYSFIGYYARYTVKNSSKALEYYKKALESVKDTDNNAVSVREMYTKIIKELEADTK